MAKREKDFKVTAEMFAGAISALLKDDGQRAMLAECVKGGGTIGPHVRRRGRRR